MSEKIFMVFPHNVVWDNQLEEVVCRCILEGIGDAENVCQRLNEQQDTISALKEENEQLRKQIQNYKQLIVNSYVGEEERLDGWVGKYVIWEDELQKMIK